MAFLSSLYTLIISPLELLFEFIFMVANRIIGNEGISIIFLSLAVNFLVLPLYKRADELQAEERDIQAKMADRIKRTKQTFKGDERFMMLQEYYRINHYKPVYALKSSASLLLQIPFFIAAYRLLSGMESLKGMPFWFISDLGKEDSIFMIGSFPVNVLPIVMTVINIVTGIIYTKGQPLKSKIQVYGLAVVFLVLLYHSPAGLVFYWLLNNVFALVKNIFYKLKNPKIVLCVVSAVAGAVLLVLTLTRQNLDVRQKILLGTACLLLALPLIVSILPVKIKAKFKTRPKDTLAFFCGAVLMALITGLLIPSMVISTSAAEFVDAATRLNPIVYIGNAMLLSFGSFVLWGGVFYFFMSDKMKSLFSEGIWIMCGASIVNYMLFGTRLGTMSSTLKYDNEIVFKVSEYIINACVVIAVAVAFHFVYSKLQKIPKTVLIAGILAVAGIGIFNSAQITDKYKTAIAKLDINMGEELPNIPLSRNGKNVVVLMLDRAVGPFAPYIFNEKPELLDKFDGFTYYPNTISYGAYTLFGSPALYGGYDYTPKRINEREEESLESKQNEALRVMPAIFYDSGYEVTICDPSFAGYQWTADLSIYDDYPEFHCFNTVERFNYYDEDSESFNTSEQINGIRNRNFFFFSLMKISPLVLQETIYDGGTYNESVGTSTIVQTMDGLSKSDGLRDDFLDYYYVLTNLSDITTITDGSENTFLMMANKTAHNVCLLQEPDYVPALHVDNTAYDTDMVSRYTVDGVTLPMTTAEQVQYYHVNMASYLQLGEWFDYLRENGVYDNTRIIIVADHGQGLGQMGFTCKGQDMEFFMPLLMVKDFDATGFTVCEDFMTNADTPSLATEGLIEDPINPFTKNPINSDAKEGTQFVFYSKVWNPEDNHGNTFIPGTWYTFHGTNPRNQYSWSYSGGG